MAICVLMTLLPVLLYAEWSGFADEQVSSGTLVEWGTWFNEEVGHSIIEEELHDVFVLDSKKSGDNQLQDMQSMSSEEIEISLWAQVHTWTELELQNTESIIAWTGEALHESLLSYSDSDADDKIDTIIIEYPEILTGTLNIEGILLFSASGWLYSTGIYAQSGYILSGLIEENRILLRIIPSDFNKIHLNVDHTVRSHLRLKTISDLRVTTILGQPLAPLTLTKSFNRYRSVEHPLPEVSPGMWGSGSQDEGATTDGGEENAHENNSESQSGSTEDNHQDNQNWPSQDDTDSMHSGSWVGELYGWEEWSGSTNIGGNSSGSTFSGVTIVFPEVMIALQRMSDAVLTHSGVECSKNPCRINFTFEDTFSSEDRSQFSCIVRIGTLDIASCNPPQQTLTSVQNITIKILHKASGLFNTTTFPVYFSLEHTEKSLPRNTSWSVDADIFTPHAIISYDGEIPEYGFFYEKEYVCYSNTCSVNLTGEESYDGDGSRLQFTWLIDWQKKSTSRDPWAFRLGKWIYMIQLQVTDKSGKMHEDIWKIHVAGKREQTKNKNVTEIPIEHDTRNVMFWKQMQGRKKRITPLLFIEPDIRIQGKTQLRQNKDGAYICATMTGNCLVNFVLWWATRGVEYHWYIDDVLYDISINPHSWSLSAWVYPFRIEAYWEGAAVPVWVYNSHISVTQTKTKAHKKKSSRHKVRVSKQNKKTMPKKLQKYTPDNKSWYTMMSPPESEPQITTVRNKYSEVSLEGMTDFSKKDSYGELSLMSVFLALAIFFRWKKPQ